ncbi:MAG TPA: adenylate/guanylate cyclase domain-containing protein [Chitinophagaceae bacterium]
MRSRLKIKLKKLPVIIIAWTLAGFLISFYDFLLLNSDRSGGYGTDYSFGFSLVVNLTSAFTASVIGGIFFLFYVNEKYRERSYGFSMLMVVFVFLVTSVLIIAVLAFGIGMYESGKSLTDSETIRLAKKTMFNTVQLKSLLAWVFIVALTQLMLSIDFKFGQRALWHFITGKYRMPKKEKRVFMFLDINSSTAIAEQLGDEKYHQLLKRFFSDITNPVLDNRGEIYQYAGDEVIVSWPYEQGIEHSNCIRSFFDVKKEIEGNREIYLSSYGLVPTFKAGMHAGTVIAGEIGVIKRDITYSGDVLNTTSRILNMCGELKTSILVSGELARELPVMDQFTFRPVGIVQLRGKGKDIDLVTVEQVSK